MEQHAPDIGPGLIALALAAAIFLGACWLLLGNFVAEARRDFMLRRHRSRLRRWREEER